MDAKSNAVKVEAVTDEDLLVLVARMSLELEKETRELRELPMTMQRIQAAGDVLDHACKAIIVIAAILVGPQPHAVMRQEPLQEGDFIPPLKFGGDDLMPR